MQQIYPILASNEVAGQFDWLPVESGTENQHSTAATLETLAADRPFLLLRTSGTTSQPKVVPLTGKTYFIMLGPLQNP
ncbi:MAG: hypothetical protein HC800_09315 [Phormidesmis sp. RL_2_1]|nr:hypothetical protein [Phormidesmis sp. RL_2_1]